MKGKKRDEEGGGGGERRRSRRRRRRKKKRKKRALKIYINIPDIYLFALLASTSPSFKYVYLMFQAEENQVKNASSYAKAFN